MKSTNDNPLDPLGNLGAPIRKPAAAPAPTPVKPGIVRNPDGSLSTNAPLPPVWIPPPVLFETGQAEDWAEIE